MQGIALIGCRNSGRKTLGLFLQKFGFRPVSFMDGPKRMLREMNPSFGVSIRGGHPVYVKPAVDSMGWSEIEKYPEVERLIGGMHNAIVNEYSGHRALIEMMGHTCRAISPEMPAVVDVENVAQAVWCREEGCFMVRVIRTAIEAETPDEMALEAYNGFDAVVNNDSTLEMLKSKAGFLVQNLLDPTWIKGGMV